MLLIGVGLTFVYMSKYGKLWTSQAQTYFWNGVEIHPYPADQLLAAKWGDLQLTNEELLQRIGKASVAESTQSNDDIRRIAVEGEHYFAFVNAAIDLLVEKMVFKRSREENINAQDWLLKHSPDLDENALFQNWLESQRVSESDLSEDQKRTVKSDLMTKAQSAAVRAYLAKDLPELILYRMPLGIFLDWKYEGLQIPTAPLSARSGGEAVKPLFKGLFFCDLMSSVCSQASFC